MERKSLSSVSRLVSKCTDGLKTKGISLRGSILSRLKVLSGERKTEARFAPMYREVSEGFADELWYHSIMNNLEKMVVEHPAFSWMDGMMGISSVDTEHGYFIRMSGVKMNLMDDLYPLLDDPPTKGGLLHLIRRAWSCPVRTEYDEISESWLVWADCEIIGYGRTEGEALGHGMINSPAPEGDFKPLVSLS